MLVTVRCDECGAEVRAEAGLSPVNVVCPICDSQIHTPAMSIGDGTRIAGFLIERSIGQGAMGQVFLATQLSMDRKVALKILPQQMTKEPDAVNRFLHEVRMLGKVQHPNIVMAFEAGESDGIYYLAMSFVDGEDLGSRIKREGKIPEKEALMIVRKVTQALQYAWEKHGILHNDLKPDNIVIDKDGDVKVMDLGLSKSADQSTGLTMSGVTFGTPNFMSPEQARGSRSLDLRSDQYALGATLYRLVSGTLPHKGTSVVEVLSKKMNEPVPSPRQFNPEVTEACEHLLEALMAKNPDLRYATWGAVIADIDRVLLGKMPDHDRPAAGESTIMRLSPKTVHMPGGALNIPKPGEKSAQDVRQPRKRRFLAALQAMVLLFGVAAVYFSFKISHAPKETAPAQKPKPTVEAPKPKPIPEKLVPVLKTEERSVVPSGWQDDFGDTSLSSGRPHWSPFGTVLIRGGLLHIKPAGDDWGASGVRGNAIHYIGVPAPRGVQADVIINGFTVREEDPLSDIVAYLDLVLAESAMETAHLADCPLAIVRVYRMDDDSYSYSVGMKGADAQRGKDPLWLGRTEPIMDSTIWSPLLVQLSMYDNAVRVRISQDQTRIIDMTYPATFPEGIVARGVAPVIYLGNHNSGRADIDIDDFRILPVPPPLVQSVR